MVVDDELLRVLLKGLVRWIVINCYLLAAWWFIDLLPLLPRDIADKLVALVLSRIGL